MCKKFIPGRNICSLDIPSKFQEGWGYSWIITDMLRILIAYFRNAGIILGILNEFWYYSWKNPLMLVICICYFKIDGNIHKIFQEYWECSWNIPGTLKEQIPYSVLHKHETGVRLVFFLSRVLHNISCVT